MLITEIIQTDYEDNPVKRLPKSNRRKQYRQVPFRGSKNDWMRAVFDIDPMGQYYNPTDGSWFYVSDFERIGEWTPDPNNRRIGTGFISRVDDRVLGQGLHSVVSKTDDPFTVRKQSRYSNASDQFDKDAYASYINTIRNLIGQNPYFPRVYRVKTTRSPRKSISDYDIETLHAWNNLDIESLSSLVLRYFPALESNVKQIRQLPKDAEAYLWALLTDKMQGLARTILSRIRGKLEKADGDLSLIQQSIPGLVQDMQAKFTQFEPELIEALTIIASVAMIEPYNPKGSFDMHSANSMIRFTSVGPQLVFSDPLT
jgi:hypothetical protein